MRRIAHCVQEEANTMALTVESALSLEVFSRVPLTLFAGEENLHRSVRWVHPVEIPDIANFLKGERCS
ncbi:hypothetical protein SVIO_105040 [Streptomyces violaceusniger]|uniref:Purine catabolism PurC-like domain-containing protein n=1 Tax=Streptomyces violaceusniger TaxID=68280 RepID=A0A4D4LE68_STRVO|nr:hypothetical protein SVIO_105040 [Streptomyces violaceusniger]